MSTIAYSGFLGGPRSMGKVGWYLVSHLLGLGRHRVVFLPWKTDYMQGAWPPEIAALICRRPRAGAIDQCISFCSVLDAWQKRVAKRMTPWIFYELASVPGELVDDLNANDHIYVTSSFVRRVFAEHGVRVPMTVLGHGVDPAVYRFHPRTPKATFTFLCVAEHTPRKNLKTLVRCFERAFDSGEAVRLVLKLGLHGAGDLRSTVRGLGRVRLLTREFGTEAEMAELYRRADCFVLPTRGEGFGMPILEAMATGLPVIITAFGGHLDFCSEQTAHLVRSRGLVDSDPGCFPYIRSQWADPDEEHLIHCLRTVHAGQAAARELGARAAEMVAREWSWEAQLGRVFS